MVRFLIIFFSFLWDGSQRIKIDFQKQLYFLAAKFLMTISYLFWTEYLFKLLLLLFYYYYFLAVPRGFQDPSSPTSD